MLKFTLLPEQIVVALAIVLTPVGGVLFKILINTWADPTAFVQPVVWFV